MTKPLRLEIGDAAERVAFITGADPEHGYDVAMVTRYDIRNVGTEGHLAHVLNDDQWQKLVDIINDALLKATL